MEINLKGEILYSKNGNEKKIKLTENQNEKEILFTKKNIEEKSCTKIELKIEKSKEKIVKKLYIEFDIKIEKDDMVFMNGYQSWTDSREYFTDEKMKGISPIAALFMDKYNFDSYGDYNLYQYSGKRGEFHGYTYGYIRKGNKFILIGSLNEKNGFTILDINCKKGKIKISKECSGVTLNEDYDALNIFIAEGDENKVFDLYFETMGIKKPKTKRVTGWTSWYNYYQNINEKIIIENLNGYREKNITIDMFQIDDGYQTSVGDWLSIDKEKFPNGMKKIADEIKSCGYNAGIWLAPLVCETNSKIYKEKQHWILKDREGKNVVAGSNWSRFYPLDIYNKEVRQYVKEVFREVLDKWGYDMVKLDFLYAACMAPPEGKTRGMVMYDAMVFLRECVGEKLILGCGVPLGSAFGLVDYCRIGCDIGLDWDDKWYMRAIHRERISTLNSIRNAAGRKHLDGRAFLNDPDVFLLRDENIMLTNNQKKMVAEINSLYGSILFTSDNLNNYNEEKGDMLRDIMNKKEVSIISSKYIGRDILEAIYEEGWEKFRTIFNMTGLPFIDTKSGKKIEGYCFERFEI